MSASPSPEELAAMPEVQEALSRLLRPLQTYEAAAFDRLLLAVRDATLSAHRDAEYVRDNATFYSFQLGTPPHIEPPKYGMTAEHDADVAYHQRAVYHVADGTWEGHPERAELFAEVKRLGQVRRLIRRVGGLKPCPGDRCALLEGHAGNCPRYEIPMWVHIEEGP